MDVIPQSEAGRGFRARDVMIERRRVRELVSRLRCREKGFVLLMMRVGEGRGETACEGVGRGCGEGFVGV